MRRFLGAMGAFLGWLLWTLHVRRGVVMSNLRLAFPEWSEARRREVGRKTYMNLGRMAPDFLLVTHLDAEALERAFVYDPGMKARVLAARESGKPVIVCTAHFGNFENLAAIHNLQGYPITMVVRALGGGFLGKLWNRGRERAGLEVLEVTRGETLQAALRAMKAGRVLGYVIDQSMPSHRAIFPTFFGVPAATAATPAILAMRADAVVFFMLDVPLEDGRHRIVIEGPLTPPRTGDRDADVLAFMQDLNDRLERHVREHPDRWYWLHRRWKNQPPADGGRKRRRRVMPAEGGKAGPDAQGPATTQIDPGGDAE